MVSIVLPVQRFPLHPPRPVGLEDQHVNGASDRFGAGLKAERVYGRADGEDTEVDGILEGKELPGDGRVRQHLFDRSLRPQNSHRLYQTGKDVGLAAPRNPRLL